MPKEFQMPNLGTQFLNLSDSIMGLIGHEWVNNVIWEQSADENKPRFYFYILYMHKFFNINLWTGSEYSQVDIYTALYIIRFQC